MFAINDMLINYPHEEVCYNVLVGLENKLAKKKMGPDNWYHGQLVPCHF